MSIASDYPAALATAPGDTWRHHRTRRIATVTARPGPRTVTIEHQHGRHARVTIWCDWLADAFDARAVALRPSFVIHAPLRR